ncbi:hypothetical protein PAEPH01_2769, partial [Pancytospora epiphaga]
TLTGTIFIFVYKRDNNSMDKQHGLQRVFENVYGHYCDCVLSNPFHSDDMPISYVKFKPEQFFLNV